MCKYIRTKDGRIIDLSDCELDDENEECYYYIQRDAEYGYEIRKNDITKQADTIEELCDVFVFRVGESVIIDQDDDKFFRGNWKCYDTIYAAIWTDKGLIYVAEMKGILPNGEIDWELL